MNTKYVIELAKKPESEQVKWAYGCSITITLPSVKLAVKLAEEMAREHGYDIWRIKEA